MKRRHVLGTLVAVTAMLAAACTSDDDSAASSDDPSTTTTTTQPERRPSVQAAQLEGPITVGTPSLPADPRPVDLGAVGYVEEEYFAAGTASAYAAVGELGADGEWAVEPATSAPYKTRFVIRRPADPSRFNGTVVVEWLNVTVVEASPEWAYTNRAIIDAGAAWVGLSAQALGVVGGDSVIDIGDEVPEAEAGGGIRASNPERYGSLAHPGDLYSFDIFSQVGAALRTPGESPVLGGESARLVVGAGESQSAAYLTTYLNAIQPVANAYDGFFVHSRGAGAVRPDGGLDITGASAAIRIRTDVDAPVLVFETETDVGPLLRYGMARQPDTDRLRVWEVAGTAHADAYLVGGSFSLCPGGINNGPQHYVATAALAALLQWVADGTAPAHGDPIRTAAGDSTAVERDAHGNALGGIRTPSLDVPVATITGEAAPGSPVICALFGSATPFDAATLSALYGSKDTYLAAFDDALDRAIDLSFVRAADRDEFAAEARAVAF